MSKYSLEAAKAVITEADKNRIICIWLCTKPLAVEWARAANKYGSHSVESFKNMNQKLLKRIEAASSKTPQTTNNITNQAKIIKPKPRPKPAISKRRKIAVGAASESASDDSEFRFRRRGRKTQQKVGSVEEEGAIVDDMQAMHVDDSAGADIRRNGEYLAGVMADMSTPGPS